MDLDQIDWIKNKKEEDRSVILDVRTEEEYNFGHIKKSILIDIKKPDSFMKAILKLKKNNSYYVYCRSGVRSEMACNLMKANGFLKTYNLVGGFLKWKGEIETI